MTTLGSTAATSAGIVTGSRAWGCPVLELDARGTRDDRLKTTDAGVTDVVEARDLRSTSGTGPVDAATTLAVRGEQQPDGWRRACVGPAAASGSFRAPLYS